MSITGRYITMRGGNIIGTPPVIIPPSLLLDLYPATAAYSVRKLRTAYTGACMRVRRSSDNTEQDIGFVDNDLDTASLLSFVGANDGFVTTWYDQQGSNNATQSTLANQTRIVTSGSLELSNGFPTNYFWTGQAKLLMGSLAALTQGEMFMVIESGADPGVAAIGQRSWKLGGSSQDPHYPFSDGNIYEDFGSTSRPSFGNPLTPLNQINLYGVYSRTNDRKAFINGAQIFSSTGTNVVSFNSSPILGSPSAQNVSRQRMTELIIFASVQDTNRTAIETNINTYYGIY
jgi:hypothetical protein